MEDFPTTAVDLTVIAIVLLSALIACLRGVIKELLSVAGWVGAFLAAYYGFPYAKPYAREYIEILFLADAATGVVLFIAALFILTFISHFITSRIKHSALVSIDRSLGFLFGLLRGGLLIIIAYILIAWVVPDEERPEWMVSARTLPIIEMSAGYLVDLIPVSFSEKVEELAGKAKESADEALEEKTRRMLEELTSPTPKAAPPEESSGYNESERRDINRLFQSKEKR